MNTQFCKAYTFGCGESEIKRYLALNPTLKELQLAGMLEHCMDDRETTLGVGSAVLSEVIPMRYRSELDEMYAERPYWKVKDVLALWE